MLRNSLLIAFGTALPLGLATYWAFAGDSKSGAASCCATELMAAPEANAEPFVPAEAFPQDAKPVDQATAGSIKGVVKFDGAAPERGTYDMSADATCKGLHTAPVPKDELVVKDGMLANVFVTVAKIEGYKFEVPKDPVKLDQKGCVYTPHVFGIMAGQQLKVANSDGVTHNVNMAPKKNPPLNQGQPAGSPEIEKAFKTAETGIPVKCDIHPWMRAVAHVAKHTCFSVSGENGAFEIKGVPPGKYTVEAIHETLGKQTAEVEVKEKAAAETTFTFKAK